MTQQQIHNLNEAAFARIELGVRLFGRAVPPMVESDASLPERDQHGSSLRGLPSEFVEAEPLLPPVQERPICQLRQLSSLRFLDADCVVQPRHDYGSPLSRVGVNACGHGGRV